jgi:hypothetical protein
MIDLIYIVIVYDIWAYLAGFLKCFFGGAEAHEKEPLFISKSNAYLGVQ